MKKIDFTYYNINEDMDIENIEILKDIEKYGDNVEMIINNNHDWNYLKTFSYDCENLINWYPFFKNANVLEINPKTGSLSSYLCNTCEHVTIIEPSKINCKIIQKRCANMSNVNIICSSINYVNLEEKYDYIILENLSNNTLEDLLTFSTNILKETGKILYFFENSIGIQNIITSESKSKDLYSKYEVESIIKKKHLYSNFYFVFPNHYIPELIFTDEYLEINDDISYTPMYYYNHVISQDEKKIFKQIIHDKSISNLANSYFVEISKKKVKKEVLFVKYNNYRKKEYNLITYYKNHKYYKKNKFKESKEFVNDIIESNTYLSNMNMQYISLKRENEEIYSIECNGTNLLDIIRKSCFGNLKITIFYIEKFWNEIKNSYVNYKSVNTKDTIFYKYGINFDNKKHKKMHYVEKLFIDMIPQNVIVKNNEYYYFDQEWVMENAPIEFLLYRIIRYTIHELNLPDYSNSYILDIFELKEVEEEFQELEDTFVLSARNSWYQYYKDYYNFNTIEILCNNLKNKEMEIENLNKIVKRLNYDIDNLNNEIYEILGSRSWKITKPLRKIANRN